MSVNGSFILRTVAGIIAVGLVLGQAAHTSLACAPPYPRHGLLKAAKDGDVHGVTHLLEHGENVNLAERDGTTALIFAAEAGHADEVKLLLAKGAKIEAKGQGRQIGAYACRS